jgi:hypothetical protein
VAELVGVDLVGEADALHGEVEPLRRDQVAHPTQLDTDYETLRKDMHCLFLDLGIIPVAA